MGDAGRRAVAGSSPVPIQFLPYHSSFITWTQRVALAADLALVWWPWRKILSGREPGPWLGPPWLWADVGLALSAGAVLFSWKAATFPGEWQEELLPSWQILPRWTSGETLPQKRTRRAT